MSKAIAITGKGGCGKTTVAALLVRLLVERGLGPVLAVDADPNLNLNAALGVEVEQTVGDVREKLRDSPDSLPGAMSKPEFLRMRVQQALVESPGFDLLAMGRPEGPGCYCYANNLLRACVDQLAGRYAFVVMDCEAGLEHLSRRTTKDLDLLLILTDPTVRGLETAARVIELVKELDTQVAQTRVIMTRVRPSPTGDGISPALRQAARQRGLEIEAALPENEEIKRLDEEGKPLIRLAADNPVLRELENLLEKTGLASS